MIEPGPPKLSKWPFYLGDILLLAVAVWIMWSTRQPFHPAALFFLVASVGAGGWLCVTPFLAEHRGAMKLSETGALTTAVEQIQKVQAVGQQIAVATGNWQMLQEQSAKTALAAREIGERMTAEAQAFTEFMEKANDSEKAHLRLEVDKLRRSEGEWLQNMVYILDHIYALYQAGLRSGQPALLEQLGNFQSACRDSARRLGLVAFEAKPGEAFNEKTHQLADPKAQPPLHACIVETVATGYSFQGQLIRCAVVRVQSAEESVEAKSLIRGAELNL